MRQARARTDGEIDKTERDRRIVREAEKSSGTAVRYTHALKGGVNVRDAVDLSSFGRTRRTAKAARGGMLWIRRAVCADRTGAGATNAGRIVAEGAQPRDSGQDERVYLRAEQLEHRAERLIRRRPKVVDDISIVRLSGTQVVERRLSIAETILLNRLDETCASMAAILPQPIDVARDVTCVRTQP